MIELKRVLGLPLLTFYGIGMILGAGIYSIIGSAVGVAGESVWLSLIFAAITATLAALSYAELATMFPVVGGEYIYLKQAFPKNQWPAKTIGLMMAFAGIASASTVALSFGGYVQHFLQVPILLIAILVLLIFTLISIWGIKESSVMNLIFTMIEIFGLLLFIYFGMQSSTFGQALFSLPSAATISGSSLIIFAFFGFENLVNFVEETKEPEKNLPRAILLSILISTILYLLVTLAALSLLPLEELSQSKAPLSDALRLKSPKAASILASIALFATANTILISVIASSRILFGMSRNKDLPKIFSKMLAKRKTPWMAAIIICFTAIILLFLNKIELLASLSSFFILISFVAVHIAIIKLRLDKPLLKRHFRTPLSIYEIPVLPVCGILITLYLLAQFKEIIYYIGFFLIFITALFLFLEIKLKGK